MQADFAKGFFSLFKKYVYLNNFVMWPRLIFGIIYDL